MQYMKTIVLTSADGNEDGLLEDSKIYLQVAMIEAWHVIETEQGVTYLTTPSSWYRVKEHPVDIQRLVESAR